LHMEWTMALSGLAILGGSGALHSRRCTAGSGRKNTPAEMRNIEMEPEHVANFKARGWASPVCC
jgi:hypothetical protein